MKTKFLTFFICFIIFCSYLNAEQKTYSNQVFLKIKPQFLNDFKAQNLHFFNNLTKKFNFDTKQAFRFNKNVEKLNLPRLDCIFRINFDENAISAEKLVDVLSRYSQVEYTELVPIIKPNAVPNDEYYNLQRHLPQIMAPEAWEIHKGENGTEDVVVAIVDSGLSWKHPDLVSNIWQNLGEDADGDGKVIEFINNEWVFDADDLNGSDDDGNGFVDDFTGWDFAAGPDGLEDNDTTDIMSHGTHCAGIAAGATNNNIGIASVSWNVKVMGTKHDYNGGSDFEASTYNGVIYAAENGADIINASWGAYFYSRAHEEVISYSNSLGVLFVCSAGNSNWDFYNYPAAYNKVLSVASVAFNDEKAYYSCYGQTIDISAPGGDVNNGGAIASTVINDGYSYMQGTSMSSPLVAGALALLKSYRPDWTNDMLAKHLMATADNIDSVNPNFVHKLGAGRINIYNALNQPYSEPATNINLDLEAYSINQALTNNSSVQLSLDFRNFGYFDVNANFVLTSQTEGVTIANNNQYVLVKADTLNTLNDLFEINLQNPDVETVNLNLSITSSAVNYNNSNFEIKLAVNTGSKVLVWDQEADNASMSGSFIKQQLDEMGANAEYFSGLDFPKDLSGYKALFISFGSQASYPYYDNIPNFDDFIAVPLIRYLQSGGGSVYIEGKDAMYFQSNGHWSCDNPEIMQYFGFESVDNGEGNSINRLYADENSIMNGLEFVSTAQSNIQSIDKYNLLETAIPAFIEEDYGCVAVQNELNNTKCFASSYTLARLRHNGQNSAWKAFKRIFSYFEIPFNAADFEPNNLTGHAPLTIDFSYTGISYPELTSIEWDFNNDGEFDSTEINPSHTFTEPGTYTVKLKTENQTGVSIKEIEILAFDGNSSLLFGEEKTNIATEPNPIIAIEDGFTTEAWIYPLNFGSSGRSTIFSKGYQQLLISENSSLMGNNALCFWAKDENNNVGFYKTDNNTINLNTWQHVAASYSLEHGVKIYINGVLQNVNASADISGNLTDSQAHELLIGENSSGWNFEGKIDEFRMWNYARTAQQIADNTEIGVWANSPGLILNYKFDEGNGNVAIDSSVNNLNGNIYSSTYRQGVDRNIVGTNDNNINAKNDVNLHNYPNPFNPSTEIIFNLKQATKAEVAIYNLKGQKVFAKYLNAKQGENRIAWNGLTNKNKPVASGVYFYKLNVNNKSYAKKMLLLK